MSVESVLNHVPFVEHLGIEITEAADGHAEAELALQPEHSSNPGSMIAHGGVTYTLADTVGGAAVISRTLDVAPTIDMRIDYVSPATTDIYAEAEVLRLGGNVGVADVLVTDADDHTVATARGVYKTGGTGEGTPWGGGHLDQLGDAIPDDGDD